MNSDRIYYSHDAEMHALRSRIGLTLLCLNSWIGRGCRIGAAVCAYFGQENP